MAAVEFLEERGPALGRPFVDTIKSSRHANMKELIPMASNIRVLFAFDPRRTAILLIGGDKSDRWDEWYREMVPMADDLYDEHLRALEEEDEER
ncbi:MAG: type II toxin-antitoxin system RelE/ParE family toxin [Actinomycetota bacterium]